MRNCEDCKACCEGYLIGSTRGSWFGNLKPCKYLEDQCTIYNDRPGQCRRYFCAWAQELFPEWMKPNRIDAVISVEIGETNKQFIKVSHKEKLSQEIVDELENFATNNKTYFVSNRVIPIAEKSNVSKFQNK